MGLIGRVRARVARAIAGGVPTGAADGQFGMLGGVFRSEAPRGSREFTEAYGNVPALRGPVDRIATGTATTQWQVLAVRKRGERARRIRALQGASYKVRKEWLQKLMRDGELEVVEDHPLATLLQQVNRRLTGLVARMLSQIYLEITGEAFWVKERDPVLKIPIEMWPIPPAWVQRTPTRTEPYYQLSYRELDERVPASEVIWFKVPNPLNPYGRGSGVAQAVGDELEVLELATKTIRQTFYNRARPDLIIHGTGLSPADTARLEESWLQRVQGFWKTMKPMFLSREIKIEKFEQNWEQLQLAELIPIFRDQIIQTWGLPPEVLGIIENSNRCHDAETQCLTRRGWVSHDDMTLEDEVATWSAERNRLEYERPTAIHRNAYSGPLNYWRNDRIDVAVTPNHRLWARTQFQQPWHFVFSGDQAAKKMQMEWRVSGGGYAGEKRTVTIPDVPYVGLGKRGESPPPSGYALPAAQFAAFLGYWISEGSLDLANGRGWMVRCHQNVGPIADKIEASMIALGMGPVGITNDDREERNARQLTFRLSNKSLASWLIEHAGHGAHNKRLPREVFEWPLDAQRTLIEAMLDGDGSRTEQHGTYYGTASEALAGDLQQLCVQIGMKATVQPREKGEFRWWVVSLSGHDTAWVNTSANPEIVETRHYDGAVWCVTVPNGIFFTRRGGRVACHGNSTIDAADYHFSRWTLVPRLELMREVLQAELVPDYDERIVLDYVTPVQEDKQYVLEAAKAAPYSRSVDEWRDLQHEAPLPDNRGKIHFGPIGLIPVPELSEDAPPRPLPQPAPAPPGPAPVAEQEEVVDEDAAKAIDLLYGAHSDCIAVLPETLTPRVARECVGLIVTDPAPVATREFLLGCVARAAESTPAQMVRMSLAVDRVMSRDVAGRCGHLGEIYQVLKGEPRHADVAVDDDIYLSVHRIADRLEGRMRQQFIDAIARARANIDQVAMNGGLAAAQAITVEAAIPWRDLERDFERITELVRGAINTAGEAQAEELSPTLGAVISFDVANVRAISWASLNAARMVREVGEATRTGIRHVIVQSLEQGLPVPDAARLIRDCVGLTESQTKQVEKFRAQLVERGITGEKLETRVQRYSNAHLRRRAIGIARTELITGANAGNQLLWDQMIAEGQLVRTGWEKKWTVSADDRLDTKFCEPMPHMEENLHVAPDGYFLVPGGGWVRHPTVHPLCRCAVRLEPIPFE